MATGKHPKHRQVDHVAQSWIGPLPPPSVLENFNAIVENGSERVFRMAEIEQQSRIEREKETIRFEFEKLQAVKNDIKRGQYIGGSIAILSILATVYSIYSHADWRISCTLVGIPIVGAIKAIMNQK